MPAVGHCASCGTECADRLGSEVYPGRADLADKIIWVCPHCGARVGSHPDGKPLGTAANPELRRARELLHEKLDPIWQEAWRHPSYADAAQHPYGSEEWKKARAIIKRTARVRVYEFLGARLGLTREECHVAMFDLETCRRAWVALRGVTYDEVRTWCRAHAKPAMGKKPSGCRVSRQSEESREHTVQG